jgi:CRISPR/Cas system CMR subunit Cmr4 (Cas7 group RAMP superfamily)
MRTTVIPAQVTTVEDKIAGNLSFIQILLLIMPVLWGAVVYVFISPRMQINQLKLSIVFPVMLFFGLLAIRIKEKIILHWLQIILRFNLRPKYYVFDKNDLYLRRIDLPEENKLKKTEVLTETEASPKPAVSTRDLVHFEKLISNRKLNLSFKAGRKGGLRVAVNEI